jgi:hypothetical protein
MATLRALELDALTIDDEAAFAGLPLYPQLREVLRRDRYRFRVLPGRGGRWDRALFLNLTFWGGDGGDVLPEARVPADVVTHAAWHHLAARAFRRRGALSVEALFLGEAIASAFDAYMVGTLLSRRTRSTFLDTQVPAMSESASAAGLSARGFEKLLQAMAARPERAFEDLRALLFDVTRELHATSDASAGHAVLEKRRAHRFAPLLHRYELSNWVLWARAWAAKRTAPDRAVRNVDRVLRGSPDAVRWLATEWLGAQRP